MEPVGYIAMYSLDTKTEYRVGDLRRFSIFGSSLTLNKSHDSEDIVSVVVARRVYRHILEDLFDGTLLHTCTFFVKSRFEEHLSMMRELSGDGVVLQYYPVYGWDMLHSRLVERLDMEVASGEAWITKHIKGRDKPLYHHVRDAKKKIDGVYELAKLIAEYTGDEATYLSRANGLDIMLQNVLSKKETL